MDEAVDAALKSSAGGFATPPGGIVTVNLEDVRKKVSHLVVNSQDHRDSSTSNAVSVTASPQSSKTHLLKNASCFQASKYSSVLGRYMCLEFCKRLDPDLSCYCHTSSHTVRVHFLILVNHLLRQSARTSHCLDESKLLHLPVDVL